MEKITTFIIQNWDAIAGIVLSVIAWLWAQPVIAERRARANEWIRVHKMSEAVDIACGIVSEIYRTTVRDLKASGKFDSEAKARVANDAASMLRRELADHGMELLSNIAPAIVEMAVNRMKGDAQPVASVEGPELDQ